MTMHIHQTTYTHGDIVYLKTDPDQRPRMVVAFTIRPGGRISYELACGPESSFHYDIEMSATADENLKLGLTPKTA